MTSAEITAKCYRGEEVDSDIPDVTLWEVAGFSYDLTHEEDCHLFELALEALEHE